jgi:hypothetical protein
MSHHIGAVTDITAEPLAEEVSDIRLVVHDEDADTHAVALVLVAWKTRSSWIVQPSLISSHKALANPAWIGASLSSQWRPMAPPCG